MSDPLPGDAPHGDPRPGDSLREDAVHDAAIRRLLAAYADVVDRRAWAELSEIFRPRIPIRIARGGDEVVELEGAEAFAGFVGAAMEPFEFFEFVVLNARIEFTGDGHERAVGRVFMTELRQDRAGAFSQVFGLYRDRYVRTGDRWWFAERRYSTIARSTRAEVQLEVFSGPDAF